jgi:hypothetical protein
VSLHAPQPIVKFAEPKKVTLAAPDARHAALSGHLLDSFQMAAKMNRSFFCREQSLEMLMTARYYHLLHGLPPDSTLLIEMNVPKRCLLNAE